MKLGEITLFQVANIGKIKFASFSLNASGELIKIAGPNETGKSTILDSLKMAFESAKAVPQDIVRHGEKEGSITVQTSAGYTITRRIKNSESGEQTTVLDVKFQGAPVPGGAVTFLKQLSAAYMDPEVVSNYGNAEMLRVMAKYAGLDLDALEKMVAEQKAQAAATRASIKALGEKTPPNNASVEPVDLEAATNAYTEANSEYTQAVSTHQRAVARIRELQNLKTENSNKLEELRAQMENISKQLEQIEGALQEGENWIKANPAPLPDKVAAAKAKLDEAVAAQSKIAEHEAYKSWYEQKQRLNAALEEATKKIEDAEAARNKAMETAQFPDASLKIKDGIPILGDGLWQNGSTSAKLMAATKLCAASIPKDGARILYIHRGESIGKERQLELAKFAKENGVQIFMEVMSDSPETIPDSITIEDGIVEYVASGFVAAEPEKKPATVMPTAINSIEDKPAPWSDTVQPQVDFNLF